MYLVPFDLTQEFIRQLLGKYLYITRKAGFTFLLFLCVSAPLSYGGQAKPAPEYQVKAAFLYNFTRFIDWPAAAFRSANAPFVIAIVGNDPFGSYIEDIALNEKVGSHPIVIRRYSNLKDVVNAHILFIHSPATRRAGEIISLVEQRSILTVSDDEDFIKQGGMVNFYKENNKVRFQINTAPLKFARLEVSSKLLSVAKITQGN